MNENDILRQAIEALQASVASLSESHRKEVDALQSKIKEQEAQIAWLKQQLFGRKSEKRPVFAPNCPDLFAAEFADLFNQAGKERDEAMGLKLSTTSVNRWQHDLAGKLFPIYERQMELVFSSPYQHIDESTIPVNDQKHKTRKGYIWDTVDGMGRYGLAFFYEKGSRAGGVLKPKLLHRRAAVQSDGYRVYENIEQSQMDGITTLYCMAHARRRLEQIKDTSPEARKILGYIATLYELEANLKFAKADHDEIRRQRQEKAVPILGFIRLMLEKYKNVDTPQSALAKACNYALERWDGLCRYCEEGYYEIDNSAVERSIRPLTLGRRNWLFVDSDDSARDTAVYLTLVGSCNLLGIAPYKYFCDILPKLHDNMTPDEYEQLLPYKIAGQMNKQ